MSKLGALFCSFVILSFFVPSDGAKDYCSICRDHTMCRKNYKKPICSTRSYGITAEGKRIILNEHNKYRQLVASGKEKRGNPGPQPPARYMPNLEWDAELANIAQTWANSCVYEHDSCRNVERFQVGQNIAASVAINQRPASLQDLIKIWYNEVAKFDSRTVEHFVFSKSIGHYSQLVWAKTTKIGCGYVEYRIPNMKNTIKNTLVCNYCPSGNFINAKVYEIRR